MGGLVLTRSVGETFVLRLPEGGEIKVKVYEITTESKVRIRIEAPKDIRILRDEIA